MPKPIDTAQQIALWADQIRDIAAQGLFFAQDIYDRDRYLALQNLAMEMLARVTDTSLEELEPLRAPVFSHFTPFTGGEGAVIDDAGRVLLIRRADSGQWALPGGALDVGETPAEGVLREVLEETGVPCQAVALVGLFDSRWVHQESRHHLYLITFLCTPLDRGEAGPPSHANEVLEVGWFAEDALPEPMQAATATRLEHAYRVWREGGPAYFDKPE
jgi:ADP-ribose pyrophosphatase YjhB (NUDIX family)